MNRRHFLQAAGAIAAIGAIPSFRTRPAAAAGDPITEATTRPGRKLVRRFGDGRDWFFQNRFGMFVHWGLYAIHGWHEQEQWRNRVPRGEYVKLVKQWNPTRYDPEAWLDLAQSIGMKYLCLTTKHHDG